MAKRASKAAPVKDDLAGDTAFKVDYEPFEMIAVDMAEFSAGSISFNADDDDKVQVRSGDRRQCPGCGRFTPAKRLMEHAKRSA